jgi:peptidoglycan hydrolase-like protein with peptidoglycan-binding domain
MYSAGSNSNYVAPHVGAGSPKGGQFTSSANAGSGGGQTQAQLVNAIRAAVAQIRTGKSAGKSSAKKAAKSAAGKRAALRMGASNDPAAVKRLQQLISDLHLGKADTSGQYDASTQAAVKTAQQKLGLKPTGVASASLVDKMAAAQALSPCK